MTMNVNFTWAVLATCVALSVQSPTASAQKSTAIEPEAAQILQQMSDYLGSLKRFSFRAENTVDTVMPSGQKLQLGANVDIAIRRPNHFRVNRKGDFGDQEFYFDGRTLTLYGKLVNYYATMTASETIDIDSGLDYAREEVGVVMPGSDLVYHNPYQVLMEDVESGMYVGTSNIGGVEVHHLAFRGSEVDWQIWIENDDTPLPSKYVITSKWITGAPQFTAVFSDWDTSAQLKDALFTFSPPPGVEKIGFIPLRGNTVSEQEETRSDIRGLPISKLSLIEAAHAARPAVHRSAHRTVRPHRGHTNVNVSRSGSRGHRSVDVDVDVRRRPPVGAVAAGIAVGTRVATLPRSCTTVVRYNVTYHHCGGVYYRPYYQGTTLVYVVVDAP